MHVCGRRDFSTGYNASFNGSSQYIKQGQYAVPLNFSAAITFAIEAEINLTATATQRVISSLYRNTAGRYGWSFYINSSGQLAMNTTSSGGTSVTLTSTPALVTGSWIRVRFVYDGTTSKLYSASSPYSSYTDITGTAVTLVTTDGAQDSFWIGAQGDGADNASTFFNGKISYVKIAKGFPAATPFAFAGYKSQPPITGIINLGTETVGEYRTGTSGVQTAGTNYIQPAYIPRYNGAAVVDSYDQLIQFNQSFANTTGSNLGLKLTMNKVTDRNQSSVQGLIFPVY